VSDAAFFDSSPDGLVPRPEARGPWSAEMLHGRLLAGIAARAVEAELGDDEFQPARLTIDLFRAAALDLLTTAVTVTRKGNRVRAAEVSIEVGEVEVARSSVLLVRTAEPPDNPVPSSPAWTSEGADELPVPEVDVGFDIRFVPGHAFGAPGVRKAWCRENRRLVAGEALTPFLRAALVADFANPFANTGANGLDYINADITLYLGRPPEGEWIGVETTEHIAANGVATSSCRLHDGAGPIGTSAAASVLTPRMPDGNSAEVLRRAGT
jgi:Acyl-CoA thioesterase C-terminal domain/Acyl-CoA thioesterase N-terminal domain